MASRSSFSRCSTGTGAPLSIARQHVIRQGEECVALGTGRERVERLLRLLGKIDRAAIRIVDRGVFLEAAQQVVPLFGRGAARGDDVADDLRARAAVGVGLEMDQ